MTNKTRNLLKFIAIVIVLVCVLMEIQVFIIPAIIGYKFWLTVVAFGLVLISSR